MSIEASRAGSEVGLLERWFRAVLARGRWVLGLALGWGVAGALLFGWLPRDLFPDLTLPTLQVLIQSPGLAPDELELAVTQPLEQALAGLPGVIKVTSTTQAGVVQVVVGFEGGLDPWRARQLVADRLSTVVPGFPAGTSPPLLTSAAGRLQEIQELVLEGPGIDPMKLRDYALREVLPRLQSVPGVARIELLGGESRQQQIIVTPERMRLAGVSLEQMVEALEGSERDLSAGVLEVRDKQWYVTVASRAASPAELRRLPVHTAHGLVALGDLAEVSEAPEFRQGLARYRGFEVVSMRVVKQASSEVLATAARLRELLPELQGRLPPGMSLQLFYDQGELVAHALGGVSRALLLGAALVAAVLVLLLGTLRGAAVVVTLLPLATLGAAVPLAGLGLGLNAMTLGGLAIAVGLLVDAGVIMVENLVHRLQESRVGEAERQGLLARAGAEVASPIATAVLVILAVFIPLLAVGGVAGRLYAPLAVAVTAAMALSLVLSFTLVPVLVDAWLPASQTLEEPKLVARLKRAYRPWLERALARPARTAGIALAAALPAIFLATRLGSDFLPALDERALMLQTSITSDASLAAIDEANRQLEAAVAQVPGVSACYRRTGRAELTEDPMPSFLSDVLVLLEPGASPAAVRERIEAAAEPLPFVVELTTPMNMRIAEGIGGSPADIELELFHPDPVLLAGWLPEVEQKLVGLDGVASLSRDTGAALPRWLVIPNDDALRRLDVPRRALAATVRAALQGIVLEPKFDGNQRIERILRFPNDGGLTVEKLKRLPIVVEEGRLLELGQVSSFQESLMPSMLRHTNGQRRLGLSILTSGDLGGTARRIEASLASLEMPSGTRLALSGKIEQARKTSRRLAVACAAALAVVSLLLLLALGRPAQVLVVLATLPLAAAGGLYALWLAGETWNASSIVGLIGLFGVAVQNSLVLIRQSEDLIAQGHSIREAVREASIGRVRPKLMTAGSAILGLLPMLWGFGGSELERPLAIVMVGGLLTSTLFTLLVLPSVYSRFAGPPLRKPRR